MVFALLCVPVSAVGDKFAALSAKADAARDAERLDEAVSLYRRALLLRPSWKDGWWSLGTIYYDQDAYAKAARAFQSLLKADPKSGTAYSMLGLCQFELGQDAAALRNIQSGLSLGLVKDQSLRNVVLYHEGILLLRQGKFGNAQDALSLMASYGADGDQAALALGMAALRMRPQSLPAEGSKEREVVLRAGLDEEQMRAHEQAIVEATSAPVDDAITWNDGPASGSVTTTREGHTQDGRPCREFQQEIKNNPRHVQSYLEIASAQYHVDSTAGAKYAEEAVKLQPALPAAHYLLGLLYADTSEYAKAITQLELAEQSQIHEPDLYYALGRAYSHTGRKQEAARARAMFLRLSSQASGQEEPNIYGEHRPLAHDRAAARAGSNNEAKQP